MYLVVILAAGAAVLLLVVWCLLIQRSDLRHELEWSKRDASRWKEEAVRRGWRNPFDECVDSLNECALKVRSAASAMRRAQEAQASNTERLKRLAGAAKEAAIRNKEIAATLERAGRKLDPAGSAAPPPAKRPSAKESIEDRLVREALRRFEEDVAAGRTETDPSKLN